MSAFLLFQVEPILAKLVLPWFGGAAAVWTISLAFYQLVYLLGNLYAHILTQRAGARLAGRIHAIALLASLFLLPILPSPFWQPHGSEEPVWRILGLLSVTIGLPFLLLSATSSLLQAWYTQGHQSVRPYRLYALSNAGSLLALLTYPVAFEPFLPTSGQARLWSVGYTAFVLVCASIGFRQCGVATSASQPRQAAPDASSDHPSLALQLLWLGLAATASALLLCVTHHISQNIAAVPLLWIVPLALYLLSLILCFEGRGWYRRKWFLRLLPVFLGGMAYALSPDFENAGPQLLVPLFCAGLFVCCMALHGEMAELKPAPQFLTLFYLMVSAGGAIGGLFVALAAPRMFRGYFELPLTLGLCAILYLAALYRQPLSSAGRMARPALWGLTALGAVLVVLLGHITQMENRQALVMVRNFYGVLRVNDVPSTGMRPALKQLRNGTIIHGAQIIDASRHSQPTTYFGPISGAGIALQVARQGGPIRVGIVGLGAGTLAAYGRAGDHYTFYEINPLDSDLARTQFDFVRNSPAQIDIVPGDARLSLERQSAQNFDVLIVDAFSGDAIPVHLLTREAFALYFRHIKTGGVLAVHVSNRYLDLPPVVEASARSVGARALQVDSDENQSNAIFRATWMLVDRPTIASARPVGVLAVSAGDATSVPQRILRPWTDDYSDLLEILK